jgi:chemotaxis protein methyltransferase CheR
MIHRLFAPGLRSALERVAAFIGSADGSGIEFTMAVTYFFRDSQTLELLIQRALPILCGQAMIRVWDAGCADGAEPYTLAMLLREQMTDQVFRKVRICATDVDVQYGPRIAAGIYAEHEVKRIPYPIRYRYFQVTDEPGYVQVVDDIRDKVSFAWHDLLSLAPPRNDFSLIVCKNVLLDFDETERRQVFRMFHGAMLPEGFLATEHTQRMPEGAESLFEPISSYAQVYRRLDVADSVRSHVDGPHAPGVRVPRESQKAWTL